MYRKKLIGLFFLFFISTTLFSRQDTITLPEKKSAVNISRGIAIAIFDFNSKDHKNPYAGLTGAGRTFSVSIHHFFLENIGLSLQWSGSSNPINTESLTNDINSKLFVHGEWSVHTSYWSYGAFGPGIILSFPLHPFIINCKSHILYSSASFPETYLTHSTEAGSTDYLLKREFSFNWGYDFSLELQYNITQNIALRFASNIFKANHSFHHTILIEPPDPTHYNKDLRIQSLQISAGVSFLFN